MLLAPSHCSCDRLGELYLQSGGVEIPPVSIHLLIILYIQIGSCYGIYICNGPILMPSQCLTGSLRFRCLLKHRWLYWRGCLQSKMASKQQQAASDIQSLTNNSQSRTDAIIAAGALPEWRLLEYCMYGDLRLSCCTLLSILQLVDNWLTIRQSLL